MNKKGNVTLIKVIMGIVVVLVAGVFVFSISGRFDLTFAQEKPSATTKSSLIDLSESIKESRNNTFVGVEGNYILIFFNKGSLTSLGNFKRAESCFDNEKSCICICYGKEEDACSSEKNKEKVLCRFVEINNFILENFNKDYIDEGYYLVNISKDGNTAHIINNINE